MPKFDRYLPDDLATALNTLGCAESPNWWKDVLSRPDLYLALRDGYLNIYARGQSVFKIEWAKEQDGKPRPVMRTHYKYLLKPQSIGQEYIVFDGDRFMRRGRPLDPATLIQTSYGKTTLRELVQAAISYSNPEKSGVHIIVKNNPNTIDVEIALSKEYDTTLQEVAGDELCRKTKATAPRIDLAVLHADGPRRARVVFYEVKRFEDRRLWGKSLEIVDQMRKYDEFLADNATTLRAPYQRVCNALVKLHSTDDQRVSGLIREVADGHRELEIDPVSRLVVFEFKQQDKKDLKTLEKLLPGRLIARGNPKDINFSTEQ